MHDDVSPGIICFCLPKTERIRISDLIVVICFGCCTTEWMSSECAKEERQRKNGRNKRADRDWKEGEGGRGQKEKVNYT